MQLLRRLAQHGDAAFEHVVTLLGFHAARLAGSVVDALGALSELASLVAVQAGRLLDIDRGRVATGYLQAGCLPGAWPVRYTLRCCCAARAPVAPDPSPGRHFMPTCWRAPGAGTASRRASRAGRCCPAPARRPAAATGQHGSSALRCRCCPLAQTGYHGAHREVGRRGCRRQTAPPGCARRPGQRAAPLLRHPGGEQLGAVGWPYLGLAVLDDAGHVVEQRAPVRGVGLAALQQARRGPSPIATKAGAAGAVDGGPLGDELLQVGQTSWHRRLG